MIENDLPLNSSTLAVWIWYYAYLLIITEFIVVLHSQAYNCNLISFNLTPLALLSFFIINFIGSKTYFLSGLQILNIALLRSIVTSKFLIKSLPTMNWSYLFRFFTTRNLLHILSSPNLMLLSVFCPGLLAPFCLPLTFGFWSLIGLFCQIPSVSMFLLGSHSRQLPYLVAPSNASFFHLYSVHVRTHLLLFPYASGLPLAWRNVKLISLAVRLDPRRSGHHRMLSSSFYLC